MWRKDLLSPEHTLLTAIIALAFILRVVGLNSDLWYDEILTLTRNIRLPIGEMATTFGSLNNHILYTWLAKFSVTLFGESAWSLRLPAFLFGVASVWTIWALFREMAPVRITLAAALLVALSYHHVWFTQNARGYTGLLFFTSFAAFALHKAMTSQQGARYWAIYAVCFFGATATHLSAVFFFLAQGIAVLAYALHKSIIQKKGSLIAQLAAPAAAAAAGGAATFLFLLPLVPDISAAINDVRAINAVAAGPAAAALSSADMTEWRNPLWTALETIRSFGVLGWALPFALGFAVYGAYRLICRAPVAAGAYPLAILITLGVLSALSFRIWPRYFFIEIGFLITAAVYGAFSFAEWVAGLPVVRKLSFVSPASLQSAGLLAMAAASIALLAPNYQKPKQDISGAIDYIVKHKGAADFIVAAGLAGVPFTEYRTPDWPLVETADELNALLNQDSTVWVVSAFPEHLRRRYPEISALLETRFAPPVRVSGTLSGGDIEIWRSREP